RPEESLAREAGDHVRVLRHVLRIVEPDESVRRERPVGAQRREDERQREPPVPTHRRDSTTGDYSRATADPSESDDSDVANSRSARASSLRASQSTPRLWCASAGGTTWR